MARNQVDMLPIGPDKLQKKEESPLLRVEMLQLKVESEHLHLEERRLHLVSEHIDSAEHPDAAKAC